MLDYPDEDVVIFSARAPHADYTVPGLEGLDYDGAARAALRECLAHVRREGQSRLAMDLDALLEPMESDDAQVPL
jgi:hypothetical protein